LVGLHFKADVFAPFKELFPASCGPFLAERVGAIGGPVLGLARLDGWVEDIRSELDLEVESVVLFGDFVDSAKDVLLSDVTKGTIL
jgi:hypothetical protein